MKRYQSLFEQYLLEDLADIKADKNDLLQELEVMYEWEYKYNQIKQRKTIRNEKRVSNVLKILYRKLNPILDSIIGKLQEVFENWLEYHAILSPRTWAKKRVDYYLENEGSEFDETTFVDMVWGEYVRYGDRNKQNKWMDTFYELALDGVEDWVIDDFMQGEINNYYEELNYAEENEDEDEIKNIQERIDEMENADGREYIRNYWGSEVGYILGEYIYTEETFTIAYEKLVFPVWYKHWKSQGIDKTRKRVEDTDKGLIKSLREKDLGKKIAYINIALNESHQTGSMMDYVEERWNVSIKDLDNLSDIDNKTIQQWNKDVGLMV